ncbi:MAG TPA: transposase [Bacillota bacterium]|nr:transposase [Bacillota bacterium]
MADDDFKNGNENDFPENLESQEVSEDQEMIEDQEERQEREALKFNALVERFRQKVALIPEDCHDAIMAWHIARRIQENRIRVNNQLGQVFKIGEKVFWDSKEIPDKIKMLMLEAENEVVIDDKGQKVKIKFIEALVRRENAAVRACKKAFEQTRWYTEVAIPAAEGVGMGPLLAGSLLWTIGDAKRFPSFGRIVRYAGLDVTSDGKSPKRRKGNTITWNPELRTTLFKLTDGWNKMPESTWRARWDGWKMRLAEERPEILAEVSKKGKSCGKGHIHNMARRKVQREFLRNLYNLWIEFDG